MPNLDQHRRELPAIVENLMRSLDLLLQEIDTVPSLHQLQTSATYESARKLQHSVNQWLQEASQCPRT